MATTLLLLTRIDETDYGIFGKLEAPNLSLVTLENHILYIPIGDYSLTWHRSPHLGDTLVPMLQNVKGRSNILMHWGNWETCSEGCILVGTSRDGEAIDRSKAAFSSLITFLKTSDPDLTHTSIRIV